MQLSLPHHLPWRVQLCLAVAACAECAARKDVTGSDAHRDADQMPLVATAAAAAVIQEALAQVEKLMAMQALDAVPPAPSDIQAYQACQSHMALLLAGLGGGPADCMGSAQQLQVREGPMD